MYLIYIYNYGCIKLKLKEFAYHRPYLRDAHHPRMYHEPHLCYHRLGHHHVPTYLEYVLRFDHYVHYVDQRLILINSILDCDRLKNHYVNESRDHDTSVRVQCGRLHVRLVICKKNQNFYINFSIYVLVRG